jgi:hypothetical protein
MVSTMPVRFEVHVARSLRDNSTDRPGAGSASPDGAEPGQFLSDTTDATLPEHGCKIAIRTGPYDDVPRARGSIAQIVHQRFRAPTSSGHLRCAYSPETDPRWCAFVVPEEDTDRQRPMRDSSIASRVFLLG